MSMSPALFRSAYLDRAGELLARDDWDTITLPKFDGNSQHPVARLCPLCAAWVWSIEKHRLFHLAAQP